MARSSCQALASVAPNARRLWIDTQQRLVDERRLAELVAEERVVGLGPAELSRRIRQTLQDGATARLRGEVSESLRKQLQEAAEGRWITILCKDGRLRRYDLRYYSQLVARTATRFAATEGTLRRVTIAGGDLVMWSVHVNPCVPLCLPRQGKVYSIFGRTPGFPRLTDMDKPPVHPHCGHVLVGIDPDFMRRRGVYDGLREFSASDRSVDSMAGFTRLMGDAAGKAPAAAAAASAALRPQAPPMEKPISYAEGAP
mgnify:CR=1 FL=1